MRAEQLVLTNNKIDISSLPRAIADVRFLIENDASPVDRAKKLIYELTGVNVVAKQDSAILHVAQYVVKQVFTMESFNPEFAIEQALASAKKLWNEVGSHYEQPKELPDNKAGVCIPQPVVIKADGRIKKGGKQVLAQQIFDEFHSTLTSAELLLKLQSDADLTQAGAATYLYNMRKAAGLIVPRTKTKK
jgi:hypothetical protein